MKTDLERTILHALLHDEEYTRKVIPYIKPKYFTGGYRLVFKQICEYVSRYNRIPDRNGLVVDIQENVKNTDSDISEAIAVTNLVYDLQTDINRDWLIDKTEEWCQQTGMELAILQSVDILQGKDEKRDRGAISYLVKDALSICFDNTVGHDYFEDAALRWDRYHFKADKIPFSLNVFNEVTDGGYEKKTLNLIIAGIHVGKSLIMCSMAADAIMDGKKVLYISMEMSEEKIAERIDANLLDKYISDLGNIPKEEFVSRVGKLRKKTQGNLITKQYPSAAAHVGHFRALLDELRIKKNFIPEVIFIDYLNICASERIKSLSNGGTYILVKSIAEEIRGLAVEYNTAIWSATQFTRDGMNSSDPDMTQTSESIGLPATVDLMWAVSQPDQMKANGQYFVKQLKNRYKNLDYKEKFVIGVDKPKMQIYDAAQEAQFGIMDSDGKIDKLPTDFNFNFGDDD